MSVDSGKASTREANVVVVQHPLMRPRVLSGVDACWSLFTILCDQRWMLFRIAEHHDLMLASIEEPEQQRGESQPASELSCSSTIGDCCGVKMMVTKPSPSLFLFLSLRFRIVPTQTSRCPITTFKSPVPTLSTL